MLYDRRKKKNSNSGWIIECLYCGKTSIVDPGHRNFCPFCGPDTYTLEPVRIQKIIHGHLSAK